MPKPYFIVPAHNNELAGKSVDELLLLIADWKKGFKSEAIHRILKMELNAVYPALEKAVRNNENADLRNGAMEALVSFGAPVVPRLIALLQDENEEVRNFSTVMLGDIGDHGAVASLIEALMDPDPNVRHGAAEALGKIGDPGAVPPLIQLLKEDYWVQYPAIVALGEMRDQRAVPNLLELVDNEMLRLPVIKALAKIGG